jgi:Tfp pilus assembly protein PilN
MLRTNLSTRPFYNERLVALAIALVAIVIAVVTAYNVTQLAALTARHAALREQVDVADQRTNELRAEAARARQAVDQRRLDAVAQAAHEVNTIIDRRTFSWTELFNHVETTLPNDVRITSVRPDYDQSGIFTVTITVEARAVDHVDAFMEALEGSRLFTNVLVRDDQVNPEGLIEATVRGIYAPPAPQRPEPAHGGQP